MAATDKVSLETIVKNVTTSTVITVGLAAYSVVAPATELAGTRKDTPALEAAARVGYGATMLGIAYAAYENAKGRFHEPASMLTAAAIGAGAGIVIGSAYALVKGRSFPEDRGFMSIGPSQKAMLPWLSAFTGAVYAVAGRLLAPLSIHYG